MDSNAYALPLGTPWIWKPRLPAGLGRAGVRGCGREAVEGGGTAGEQVAESPAAWVRHACGMPFAGPAPARSDAWAAASSASPLVVGPEGVEAGGTCREVEGTEGPVLPIAGGTSSGVDGRGTGTPVRAAPVPGRAAADAAEPELGASPSCAEERIVRATITTASMGDPRATPWQKTRANLDRAFARVCPSRSLALRASTPPAPLSGSA